MKKRILSMLIVISLCLLWVPMNPARAETSKDGKWSYDKWNKKILRYYGNAEKLTVPDNIDGWPMEIIGNGAFSDCISLKTVDLGDSIRTIGKVGFGGCTNLKSIKGKIMVAIGDEAFRDCTSLVTIDLKIGYKEIGYRAFENCRSLKEFTIPDGITTIHDEAFKGCTSLKTIVLHKNLTKLGDGVFAGCTNLDGIWAAEGSYYFSNDEYGVLFNKDKTKLLAAPGGTVIGTYVVPDTVTRLARYAFAGCDKLETIIIPDTVTDMGTESFENCTALQTVVMSGGSTLQHGQFRGCTALETIVLNRDCPNETFEDCKKLKSIYCYTARTGHATNAFQNVKANMYYVESKTSKTLEELQPHQFCGEITWVPLQGYCVAKGNGSTYAVGSDIGAIFLIMAPWDALKSVWLDGSELSKSQYMSMTKGTSIILKDAYLKTLSLGEHTLAVNYSDGSCEATFTLTDKVECKHKAVTKAAKAPTCTKSGLTEGSYCSKCGEVLKAQKKIDKLGHDYEVTTVAPTCTEVGYDLHECSRCGKTTRDNETPALGHTFGHWETVKEPTVEETGLSQRACDVCGETEQQELEKLTPPPTDPPTEPPTDPPTQPGTTAPGETEPLPTQPSTTAPSETEPVLQDPPERVDLLPLIILGAVLLVITAGVVLHLFHKNPKNKN